MSIINFTIAKPLELQVKKMVKQYGFNSKAELFRFALVNFMNNFERNRMSEDEELDYLTHRFAQIAHEKLKRKKLPSIEEQLRNI